MKHWTIAKRILAGFLTLIAIAALANTLIYFKLSSISAQSRDLVTNWLPSSLNLISIRSELRAAQNDLLENMATVDPQETKQLDADFVAKLADVEKQLQQYKDSGSIDQDRGEQAYYDRVSSSFLTLKDKINRLRDLIVAVKNDEASQLYVQEVRPAMRAAIDALQGEIKFNTDLAYSVGNETLVLVTRTILLLVAGVAASILLGIAIAWVIVSGTSEILRRVAKSLADTANEVSTAAGQVASASQGLANGASEQAASLEETSASLEEISSMTRRNAENAANAQDISAATTDATQAGSRQMGEMVDAMSSIKSSSDNVSKIIKTIDEIAFQTNILALNAAVEAARAGEAGAGFAVVADEVRALAQRAAQASRETAEKIQESIQHSTHGVAISDKVANDLGMITAKTREVDGLVKEIASASKEQSQGLAQITDAVAQMDKVTQSNAASAEETAAAAEELSAQSRNLLESVSDLNRLVGSSVTSDRSPAQSRAPASRPGAPVRNSRKNVTVRQADDFFRGADEVATETSARN